MVEQFVVVTPRFSARRASAHPVVSCGVPPCRTGFFQALTGGFAPGLWPISASWLDGFACESSEHIRQKVERLVQGPAVRAKLRRQVEVGIAEVCT